jgi:hypothetical protein
VTAREEADQDALDDLLMADHGLRDLSARPLERVSEGKGLRL